MLNRVRIKEIAKPSLIASILCLLLFTGPPKFRIRDAEASLSGELDVALILNILVWLAGGAWVALRVWKARADKNLRIKLFATHKLAALVVFFLAVSIVVSLDRQVTAFKVFQILVALLFTSFFIEFYGVERFLDYLLLGNALLCGAIVICAAIAPDLVLFTSETGVARLRGEAIADAGVIAALGTILLFTTTRKLSLPSFVFLSALFGSVLLFSLARIAWLAVALFFGLALLKRPKIRKLKWVYAFWAFAAIALLMGAATHLSMLRDPESVSDLSGRLGLWAYLGTTTLTQSPWLGLGYLAASREIGMQYNPELGSGHSIFFDVFVGGGIITECVFVALVIVLLVQAIRLLRRKDDAVSFAVGTLTLAAIVIGAVGADIDSSPFGFTFWGLVTMLPLLQGVPERVPRISTFRWASWAFPEASGERGELHA
jgi:O-Antigen ligase